ncbi:hypothetical protein [Archangium lansingense]|uniref:FG-GAP repeat protein n=1 Tax=Archangium lansingense TaxID=2995310 RepID=A0ABT3ZUS6_9BACT|nr:hypothetical protein [Archangium lansinium]MCY1073145.1 hypothetical protein [Archangium lansinium]
MSSMRRVYLSCLAAVFLAACPKAPAGPPPPAEPRPEHPGEAPPRSAGPEAPEAEALLAAAEKSGLDVHDRLEHAARAATLAPKHPGARAALRKHYLDYQFDRLAGPGGGGGAPPLERHLPCASPATPDGCLADALFPQRLFGAKTLERRDGSFVGVGARDDHLYVVRGTSRPAEGGLSYVVLSRAFEDADARLVAEALGLKVAEGSVGSLRYVTDGEHGYSRTTIGSRLEVRDGAREQVLIDLQKHIPPGKDGEIRADLRGQLSLALLFVGDFDQDGRDDALVYVSTGGNCCAPCYLFASVPREGAPVVTGNFCTWQAPPLLGEAEGKPTFTITDEEGEKTFVFAEHEARQLSVRPRTTLETVFEYTADELWKVADEQGQSPDFTTVNLKYDLDEDGRAERIECKGWVRWNGLRCNVYRADGRQIGTFGGCKRVGVLSSRTQGMHDMVCDKDEVSRWNGTAYP